MMTCYWFSQGTSKDEKTCPGGYKTYCGYCGGETGAKPTGDGQNWCPINDISNTVKNIPTTHFVAIPPGPLGNGKNCGACVEVSYMGRSIVATVIDACPSCTSDQHIDMSLSAAKELGMTELMGEVKSGVTWRIVGCPTTGNIAVGFNGGYQGQVYFQNVAFPIAKASSGGKDASANTGFWDFGKVMGGQEVTLTDVMGHTVTATVPSTPGTLGVQFPLTCH
jgi:expansin (peptidoglycan-binding protein)